MFKTFAIALTIASIASSALAEDSRITTLCGADHSNEIASENDVRSNPDGYYVASIGEQVSLGDPRIVLSNREVPYLCTRPAATPDMDATNVALNQDKRVTRWLFVQPHPFGN